jgi:ABC-type multidrug transport system ATPase subunit
MDTPVIVAAGLRKAYGSVTALDGLSFEVPAGSMLSPGGSGKTTAATMSILTPAALSRVGAGVGVG